jgi:serine/threonine protein kinase
MDYCPGGELFYHIKDGLLADNASVKVYFCEILSCIEFLHNNRILYRDLKVTFLIMQPENILVDGEGHLRIADFGLSKMGFK